MINGLCHSHLPKNGSSEKFLSGVVKVVEFEEEGWTLHPCQGDLQFARPARQGLDMMKMLNGIYRSSALGTAVRLR